MRLPVVAFAEEYLLAVVAAAGDMIKTIFALKSIGYSHTLILSKNREMSNHFTFQGLTPFIVKNGVSLKTL